MCPICRVWMANHRRSGGLGVVHILQLEQSMREELLTGGAAVDMVRLSHSVCAHPDVVEPFLGMQREAARVGIALEAVSGFRDFERQAKIWSEKARGTRPALDSHERPLVTSELHPRDLVPAILRWTALPGASRHHWGTDFDVVDRAALIPGAPVLVSAAFTQADGGMRRLEAWLSENAVRFGFYRPYDQDRGGVAVPTVRMPSSSRREASTCDWGRVRRMGGGSERAVGHTGLHVSPLGLGGGPLGDPSLPEEDASRLLQGALDLGITLVDTAPSYGLSEERVGRHLRHRRNEFVLSTKCGYGVEGAEDWTPACIAGGVDRALQRLRTDYIDILHLHSCPMVTLVHAGVVEALEAVVRAGKVRVAAYSGEGEALQWARRSGRFGAVQRSVNLCDQGQWEDASGTTLGVLAKRVLMNGAFRDEHHRPGPPDVATYWDRLWALELSPGTLPWAEYAIRFAAFSPGVSSALAGTRSLARLEALCRFVEKGPLPASVVAGARQRYLERGRDWPGVV